MAIANSTLPDLRLATLDDYDRIVALEAANGMASMRRDDWQALWLNNPLWPYLGEDWPVGWVMETDDGRVVGSIVNVPTTYQFRGEELLCANGRGWVVDADYRPFALMVMGEYFGQTDVDLFVNTTVGPNAAPMIASLSHPIPQGDFETFAYFTTDHQSLAAKGLRRKGVPLANLFAYPAGLLLRMRDAWRFREMPAAPRSTTIESIAAFDDRFDTFWQGLVRQKPNTLLGTRDRATLAWHFAAPLRRGDLWIITAVRDGLLRGYCILKRQDPEQQFKRMRVVDFQSFDGDADLLGALLKEALRRADDEQVQIIEHMGCGVPKMAAFDRFAPYRRTQACWPFYYRAVNDALAAELTNPVVWEASVYDGDSSFE